MENLNERAVNYAAEKTNELLAKAIAQAYADGYRDGYEDRQSNFEAFTGNVNNDFINLGLPSGTKWSTKLMNTDEVPDYLPYAKAASLEIPTIEQVEELVNCCRWQAKRTRTGVTFEGAKCIGYNGEIFIPSWGYYEGDRLLHYGFGADKIFFWIRNEEGGDEMKAVKFFNVKDEKPEMEIVKLFPGFKLPVMLVSNI